MEYDHKHQDEGAAPKKRIKTERKLSETKNETEVTPEVPEVNIKQEDVSSSNWDIDNPYLAATKLPVKSE